MAPATTGTISHTVRGITSRFTTPPSPPTYGVVVEAFCREGRETPEVAAVAIEVLRDAKTYHGQYGVPFPIDDDRRFGTVYNLLHTVFRPGNVRPKPGSAHDLANRYLLPQGQTFRHTSRDGVTRSGGCGFDCMTVEAARI